MERFKRHESNTRIKYTQSNYIFDINQIHESNTHNQITYSVNSIRKGITDDTYTVPRDIINFILMYFQIFLQIQTDLFCRDIKGNVSVKHLR